MKMCQSSYSIIKMTRLHMDRGRFHTHSPDGKSVGHEQNLKVIGQPNHAVLSRITIGFEKRWIIGNERR